MPRVVRVESLAEIAPGFVERAHAMVWCAVATVDGRGRPRSRVLHPIWEFSDGELTGWIATRRESLKAAHLAVNPHVSLAYVADVWRPVYADCRAGWEEDSAARRRVWDLYRRAAPPLGYDPAGPFTSPDHPGFGLLRLRPWRITVAESDALHRVWRLEGSRALRRARR